MAENYELETINVEGKTVRLTDKQLTDRFNTEVTNRTNADTSLDNKISAEVKNRENADTVLRTNIDKANSIITNITENKTEIILFGDSWVDYNSDKDNVRIPQILTSSLGLTVHNYSHGGTGFTVSQGYMEQLDEFKNDTSFDHTKIKYCILVAGLNEYNPQHSAESFINNLRLWIDKARTLTTAPIYWFFDYSMVNDVREELSRTFAPQRDYFNTIKTGLNRDISCTNMMGWVEWSPYTNNWNTANYYHPNVNGSIQVAMNMVAVLTGNTPIIYCYAYIIGTWDNPNNKNLSKMWLVFHMYGEQLYVSFEVPTYAKGTNPTAYEYDITFNHNLPAELPDLYTVALSCFYEKRKIVFINDGNDYGIHSGAMRSGFVQCSRID